mmetsp:Transcript_42232/g.136418  ORF Transcript_42232/g.136418 Transcript_42232/m.136418 type:complete len:216 (+) Transcript_42232:891-1538(+)
MGSLATSHIEPLSSYSRAPVARRSGQHSSRAFGVAEWLAKIAACRGRLYSPGTLSQLPSTNTRVRGSCSTYLPSRVCSGSGSRGPPYSQIAWPATSGARAKRPRPPMLGHSATNAHVAAMMSVVDVTRRWWKSTMSERSAMLACGRVADVSWTSHGRVRCWWAQARSRLAGSHSGGGRRGAGRTTTTLVEELAQRQSEVRAPAERRRYTGPQIAP